ncbi:ribonuclease H-like domain-containing protein [Tanacetum coccineum]
MKSVNKENTHKQVEYPRKSQSPRGNRRNYNGMMTQKLRNDFEFIKKACFVCGSFNHLIKDCYFHDKKMVEKPVLNNKGRVTGQREIRPVWNNAQRVNHQNKFTHPHLKRNFVPTAVVTKSRQVLVNTAKQSSPRAATSISTVRPVNTATPKPKVNDALPITYSYFKAYSPVRRAINQKSSAKTNNFNEKVNTAKVNNVTTAGPKAVVSAAKGNRENVVKSSACWIWRPTRNVIDHTSKDSGSYMFKGFDYVDLQGRLKSDQGIFDSGCSRHMTGNKSFLTDYQEIDGGFVAFGGSLKGGKITRKGKIKTRKLDFEDVYFVQELKFNLFSVSQMCDKKNSVLFTKTECLVLSHDFKLLDKSQVLLKVPRQNNMYSFDLKDVVPLGGLTCLFAKATIDESNLWHRRLGHIKFKTMNKLVKGNLVRGLPSKLFENDHTYVACQKGKQHKASSRTMLADLLLPTTFWAEAINTACYVQNRVLVTKPHNKTPYELLIGRPPNLDFMRPFGCSVTILNTLDHLGKFEGKDDEGFLVGYSVNSKAFRVFNTRTRKVKENLHIKFLENKSNVAGSGPEWLFDIDSLTKSMNYEPVTAGNQTSGDAGIKTNVHAGQAGKEKASNHKYILLPFMPSNSTLFSNTQSSDDKDTDEVLGKGDVIGKMLEIKKKLLENNLIETGRLCCWASININTVSANDPSMPYLEDTGIFDDAYDDREVGVEADTNNLELSTIFSPIPTTRKMLWLATSASREEQITKIIRTAYLPVFSLNKNPKRNKKDERGIVVRNKARLVAQGYTQEEGIDYDEVFALVAKIEAIRLFLAYKSFMGFIVYQMDVKSAFLYGTIEEEVFMSQPPGFEDPQFLDKMSSMGELTFFLGLQVKQKDDGIFISQDKYMADILKKFDFATVKITSTPMELNASVLSGKPKTNIGASYIVMNTD